MSSEIQNIYFKIETKSGTYLKPTSIKIENSPHKLSSSNESSTQKLHYKTESLVGLSLIKLGHHYKFDTESFEANPNFINWAWRSLDPHFELYWKTQNKLTELMDQPSSADASRIADLEKSFDQILSGSLNSKGLNLEKLNELLEKISGFEDRSTSPLLFDFSIKFSSSFIEKLHALYSLLFHLRSLIALDHNSLSPDTSHHSVRVDSISDYLSDAEFIASGAALYWNFKKQTQPFQGHKGSDPKIETLLITPLQKSFESYLHHSYCLIENTPKNILKNFKKIGIDEDFYRIEMNWLLGAPSGILYRVKEELFGLIKGYENLFWPETTFQKPRSSKDLNYTFELSEKELFGTHQNVG